MQCGKNPDVAELKFLVLSCWERQNMKSVKLDSCLTVVSLGFRNKSTCITVSGHSACRDYNKMNIQPGCEALNTLVVVV